MSENTDTRPDTAKAPLKQTTKASKPPKAAKPPKPPKAPKEPKPAPVEWAPPQAALDVVEVMRGFAAQGDKKVLAYFVAEAIDCRARGKEAREQCTTSPIDEAVSSSESESISDETAIVVDDNTSA